MKIFFAMVPLALMLSSCSVKFDEGLHDRIYNSNLLGGDEQIGSTSMLSKCGRSDLAISERERHEFVGDRFIRTKVLYNDVPCDNEIGVVIHKGRIDPDNNPSVDEVLIHVKNESFAKYLNENAVCNFRAFHEGQSIRFRGQMLDSCPQNVVPTTRLRAVHQLLSDLVGD